MKDYFARVDFINWHCTACTSGSRFQLSEEEMRTGQYIPISAAESVREHHKQLAPDCKSIESLSVTKSSSIKGLQQKG